MGFLDWYHSIPTITKYWFTLTALLNFFVARFYIVDEDLLLFDSGLIYKNFEVIPILITIITFTYCYIINLQLWRPLSAVIFYPITANTIIHFVGSVFVLYKISLRLENEEKEFKQKPADYLWILIINWLGCCIFATVFGSPVNSRCPLP